MTTKTLLKRGWQQSGHGWISPYTGNRNSFKVACVLEEMEHDISDIILSFRKPEVQRLQNHIIETLTT